MHGKRYQRLANHGEGKLGRYAAITEYKKRAALACLLKLCAALREGPAPRRMKYARARVQ